MSEFVYINVDENFEESLIALEYDCERCLNTGIWCCKKTNKKALEHFKILDVFCDGKKIEPKMYIHERTKSFYLTE